MITIAQIVAHLETIAPPHLAEEWDNVGLLVGDRDAGICRVMTCLTLTPSTVDEAVRAQADLVVSHHPLPFRPLRQITRDTTAGDLLLRLIRGGIGVYSAHTAFDSGPNGINQQLAEGLRLRRIAPLIADEENLGSGRLGQLDRSLKLGGLSKRVKQFLRIDKIVRVGADELPVRTVGIACGAADELLPEAMRLGCDAVLLGEARFHTCLEAEARGVGLLLAGHYASERFAVESLAEMLSGQFDELDVWASRDERDPVYWD